MDKKYEALFTPFRIGTCEIKNRVIIPAMEGTNIVEMCIRDRRSTEDTANMLRSQENAGRHSRHSSDLFRVM